MKCVLLCGVFAAIVSAQTMVEHSAITAGSTMGAGGMSGAGKAAAKVFENAGKALGQAGTQSQSTVIAIPRNDDNKPKPKAVAPDAKAIQTGMTAAELTTKFGPPSMKVNGANSETWFYGSAPDELVLELKAGKVATVTPPKKSAVQETAKSDTGVVVIQ